TQRFLSYLTRMLIEARSGTLLYQATDSLAVISTPNGGFLPCPGGPFVGKAEDGAEVEGWWALSFAEVDQIRSTMEAFSPYPPELRPWGLRIVNAPTHPSRFGFPVWRPRAVLHERVELPGLLKLEPPNFNGG